MENYEELAREAAQKAREAYELAERSDNPYAPAKVTQLLADGDLILLSTARSVISR